MQLLKSQVILIFLLFISLIILPEKLFASADLIGTWTSTTSLPFSLASFSTALDQKKIFIIGGATDDDYSDVFSTDQSNNGSISNWTKVNDIPETRYWASSARWAENIYILGGAIFNGGTGFSDSVYYSKINLGTLGSWSSLTPLPKALAHGGTFVANNRLYFAGGLGDGDFFSNIIYSAPINSDGTIGNWVNSGILPSPMYDVGIFEVEGKVYLLGGAIKINGVGEATNTISVANLNSDDGTISGWQPLPNAPTYISGKQTTLVGNTFVYITANKAYYASILQPGSLTSWHTSSNTLPKSIGAGRLVYLDGYLYLIGGYGGGYLNSVYYAPFETQQGVNLLVPLLKQTDPNWKDDIYDSANRWSSNDPGVGRWGCAMTSAVMIFNYHKITKLPDGSALNPKNLNIWLKNQPDGYIGNGLLNWQALSRLSKKAKLQNPDFSFDALEYKRVGGSSSEQFKSDIDDNIASVLEEPGHFVVGRGYDDSSILINDPYYSRTDLSAYGGTFLSRRVYTPSNTDLSYIIIASPPNVEMQLFKNLNEEVGDNFVQNPVLDPSGENSTTASPVHIIEMQKPGNENYTIRIASESSALYDFDLFLYEDDGDVDVRHLSGIVGLGKNDSYSIQFDSQDLGNTSLAKEVSFDSLISDIDLYFSTGHIFSAQTRNLLLQHALLAKKFYMGKSKGGAGQLQALIGIIAGLTPQKVDSTASQNLINTILQLKNSL